MKDVNWWWLEIQAGLELASTAWAGLGQPYGTRWASTRTGEFDPLSPAELILVPLGTPGVRGQFLFQKREILLFFASKKKKLTRT